MKKIILCTVLIGIAIASYAGNNRLNPEDILSIKPQVSTKTDLENMFGKPDKYVETNEQGSWEYKTTDMTITIIWETKTGKVQRYNIHMMNGDRGEWANKNLQHLKIGTSTLGSIVEYLGMPSDMYAEPKSGQLKYRYQNIALSARFNNGVLTGFNVEQTKP